MNDQILPVNNETKEENSKETPCPDDPVKISYENTEKDLHPASKPVGRGMKILFYLLSFLFFPGIIFGAVFYSKDDEEYRQVGKNCLFIALAPLFFWILITILALFLGQTGDIFTDRVRDIPY